MKNIKMAQLNKAYRKRFNLLEDKRLTENNVGLILFVEHLKYIRDSIIMKNIVDIEQEPLKTTLATLATAIAEFDAYMSSQESIQRIFHWNSFCDFLKLNMEEWLALNDSI